MTFKIRKQELFSTWKHMLVHQSYQDLFYKIRLAYVSRFNTYIYIYT
jgi:hypothetical protein